jgi:hypothetical protein
MKNWKKYLGYFIILMTTVLFVTGCADVTNIDACKTSDPVGFWSGLWHGLIAFFSFFGSLFDDNIAIYAVNNSGHWYDFGFVLGSGILGYGTKSSTNKNK